MKKSDAIKLAKRLLHSGHDSVEGLRKELESVSDEDAKDVSRQYMLSVVRDKRRNGKNRCLIFPELLILKRLK